MRIAGKALTSGSFSSILTGIVIGLLLVLTSIPSVRGQANPPPSLPVILQIDSGDLANTGSETEVVWSTEVVVPNATWLRLQFETLTLAYDPETLEGSVLRTTSLLDDAVQHLNAVTAGQWRNTTAYFNGDKLLVELLALPGSTENRVVISGATAGLPDEGLVTTICGPDDDRLLSYSNRDSRVMPVGCTCFIIDDAHHQFLTAGHCSDSPNDLDVAEFNVPLSSGSGSLNHPGPEDQYAVDQDSRQSHYGGQGDDWSYFGCFPNTETGLTPFLAGGGEYYVLADAAPPVSGQTITITGYGTVSWPIPPEWNQVQKNHSGPYYDQGGTSIEYRTDTTGGNSGSCVFNEDDGEAIGIHTHGGCTESGGSNSGTAIHHSGLQNALANPRGICAPVGLNVTNLVGGETATLRASGMTPGETVYFGYSLAGTGETPANFLGVILGITRPNLIGTAVANGSGVATLDQFVSPRGTGMQVWLQAAQMGLTTVVFTDVIQ